MNNVPLPEGMLRNRDIVFGTGFSDPYLPFSLLCVVVKEARLKNGRVLGIRDHE